MNFVTFEAVWPFLDMSDQAVIIRCRVWGGETGVTAKLAPKLGPLGVPAPKVASEVAKVTDKYKGFRASVKITVQNREFTVEVENTTPTLLIAALNEPHRDRKKVKKVKHSGNLSLDTIIDIARTMRFKSCSRNLCGTVKEVLGTAGAIGCTVDNMKPKEVQAKIASGEIPIPEQ